MVVTIKFYLLGSGVPIKIELLMWQHNSLILNESSKEDGKESRTLKNFFKHRKIVPALVIAEVTQQAVRIRRLETPQNPTRGYLDPATVEQHRMIGQVRGYNHNFKQPAQKQMGVCYNQLIITRIDVLLFCYYKNV